MTAKQTISLKIDADRLARLKQSAKLQNRTITDIVFEHIDGIDGQHQL